MERVTRKVPPVFFRILVMLITTGIFASCATVPRGRDPGYALIVSEDTVWSGEVTVDGVVLVRKGATLTVMPGTRISFSGKKIPVSDEHEGFSGSGIKVEGRIVASGSRDEPIRFTSSRPDGPGSWDRIYFAFSKGNILENCIIEYGRYVIHAHFSQIAISSSLVRRNIEGVRLGGSRVTIKDSVFTGNSVRGINFRECRNTITGCAIYNNGVGIFLHSKNSLSVIRDNAIYNNRRYDLQVGDLHVDDMDVSRNWWGSGDPSHAAERVYDGSDQEGIGRAAYSPILEKPPVKVSSVRGFLTYHKKRQPGEVYALKKLDKGFFDTGAVAFAETDDAGEFEIFLPPGRYFLYARAKMSAGDLFGFTGNNPVLLEPFGEHLQVIPLVDVERAGTVFDCAGGEGGVIEVSVMKDREPVQGAFAYVYGLDAVDIRGPGIASGVTSSEGTVRFAAAPGDYIVVARKRTGGQSLGFVEYGGLFGISPRLPVSVRDGCVTRVAVPVFVKEGILSGGEEAEPGGTEPVATALLQGVSAEGYMVYFYATQRAVGRPEFVSGVVSKNGSVSLRDVGPVEDGTYFAYLRRASPDGAGSTESIAGGPIEVRIERGVIRPLLLEFERAR